MSHLTALDSLLTKISGHHHQASTLTDPDQNMAQQTNTPKKTFYRRELPSPPAISFSSKEGKQIFKEALQSGYMEGYFVLAEQFRVESS